MRCASTSPKQIMELAERFHMQVATLNCAKGAVPESSAHFVGTYAGSASAPATREAIEAKRLSADGWLQARRNDDWFFHRQTARFCHPPEFRAMSIRQISIIRGFILRSFCSPSLTRLRASSRMTQPARPSKPLHFVPSDDPLTQDAYWKAMQNFLRPGDVIVVEDGTSSAGMGRLTLPDDCIYITGAFVWCSIGYATGALLGAILASPGRRHILLTGEGSLQMTVQELSTVMRHDLKPLIFVISNSGYTVERAVLGKDAKYNDVANWRYSELPNVFSRDKKAETYVVTTSNELQKVLDSPHSAMVFVESVMDKYDAPIDLIVGGHALADSDYGVPGPQSAANSQIPLPTRSAELDKSF